MLLFQDEKYNLTFPIRTLQSIIFGFWGLDTNDYLTLKHLLLIFKMYIYNARTTVSVNISHLLMYIKFTKDSKKKLRENDAKRRKKINKKRKNVLGCTYIKMKWM